MRRKRSFHDNYLSHSNGYDQVGFSFFASYLRSQKRHIATNTLLHTKRHIATHFYTLHTFFFGPSLRSQKHHIATHFYTLHAFSFVPL